MQLFLDSASIKEIQEASRLGVISGVTTNPSLVAREGSREFHQLVHEICRLVEGPVSAEVISLEAQGMEAEARQLAAIHPQVVIKIPMTAEGLKTVHVLEKEGIKTNVTLVFSLNQALLAARAGAAFVSIFVGRLDDIGQCGMDVVREAREIFSLYDLPGQLIAASIRHPRHAAEAALSGSDIATIPYKVLLQMYKHPLTDAGIDRFLKDWEKLGGQG